MPETYMVDGTPLQEAEVRRVFSVFRPADRQRKALELLSRCSPGKLLDVGCYSGQFLREVHRKISGFKCTGVDSYEDNIRVAKLLHPDNADCFLVMSAYHLDFPDEHFDAVTMLEVIEHLDRPIDALKEINRILRPDGVLILSTPNACSFANMLASILTGYKNILNGLLGRPHKIGDMVFFENVSWNRHVQEYHPAALATVLKVTGFELVKHSFVSPGIRPGIIGMLCPGLNGGQVVLAKKKNDPNSELV